ncbi:hypothetical protein AC579_4548 [Pseudocercospora musae]|uniref:Uncharacterized protein n=1 Tax=Pseudocercospora musae TaxID=113226 RepID=A0A139ITZ6_9PEZI|nr:hypothetical protein AC579_4548 [Pseudocercospora musae]
MELQAPELAVREVWPPEKRGAEISSLSILLLHMPYDTKRKSQPRSELNDGRKLSSIEEEETRILHRRLYTIDSPEGFLPERPNLLSSSWYRYWCAA